MRRASLGVANETQEDVLIRLGFAKRRAPDAVGAAWEFTLTDAGRAFDDAANVYGNTVEAERLFREAYLRMPVTQAIMQGIHGRRSVPVTGALHLLARHKLADADNISAFRQMLTVLNWLGIVRYSAKHQTVRLVEAVPDSQDETDAPQPSVRIVQPERPYSNVRNLREVLRACKDYIWWADPHFGKKGLEALTDEADATKIKEIRILSGPAQATDATSDYKRFRSEMNALGITVEWRVVQTGDRDWHDRFIVSRSTAWNTPPLNTIYKGDYSEFSQTQRPPFEEWWRKGAALN
jgi:hypothetical protein